MRVAQFFDPGWKNGVDGQIRDGSVKLQSTVLRLNPLAELQSREKFVSNLTFLINAPYEILVGSLASSTATPSILTEAASFPV